MKKIIKDIKTGIILKELYPPTILAFKINSKGKIDYVSKLEKRISARKTVEVALKKLLSSMKMSRSDLHCIYFRRLGSKWEKLLIN
jgi:hypothetical protein